MSEKIMMDGEPLEVGDEVYSLIYGWVTIVEINHESESRPIIFTAENGLRTNCLKSLTYHPQYKNRDLYWQKPEIIPPPKRKKKVKVWDWFVEWDDGKISKVYMMSEGVNVLKHQVKTAQKIDGTEREIEV